MSTPDPKPLGNAAVVAELAAAAASARRLERGHIYVVPPTSNHPAKLINLDTAEDRWLAGKPPHAKSGVFQFHEPQSMAAYVNAHKDGLTSLWVNRSEFKITAIFDEHGRSTAGWRRHRAMLVLIPSDEWTEWSDISGKLQGQLEFSEFLEDHLVDIREPDAATLLEIVTTLQAKKDLKFRSGLRLASGAISFEYDESLDATAGRQGNLAVPESITLALRPFDGVDPYRVTARLRYRLNSGTLKLGVILDRPKILERDAFTDIEMLVAQLTDIAPFIGISPMINGGIDHE